MVSARKATMPPLGVVNSSSLTEYQLSKPMQKLLLRFNDMERYLALANKKPLCLRLRKEDYVEIDNAVKKQSEGKWSLALVNYKGYPILSATD